MKSIMISIQPKWVEKIANGKKVFEVRKTRPKIEKPYKCYIYCTQTKTIGDIILCKSEENAKIFGYNTVKGTNKGFAKKEDIKLKGKVIGEFVCDYIEEHTIYSLTEQFGHKNRRNRLLELSCLTWQELTNYIGDYKSDKCYAWHISDLKIYDKPKELSEFYSAKWDMPCEHKKRGFNMDFCMACENGSHFCKELNCDKKRLKRPPQSWCYVESLGE